LPFGRQSKAAIDYREQVAHREAAQAWTAHYYGAGLPEGGIELDAPSSAERVAGNAGVHLFTQDASLSAAEQMTLLLTNLQIVCAGAASDAKLTGIEPDEALRQQPSDQDVALTLLAQSPLIDKMDQSNADKEIDLVLSVAITEIARLLDEPETWSAVQKLARGVLDAGGKLSKADIELLLDSGQGA
jgi:hypothetical protein